MHILILTENNTLKNLLQRIFLQSDCFCKTVRSFCDLFIQIKNKVPDCIILDKGFFPGSYTREDLISYIKTGIFFKKFGFLIFLYEENNTAWFTEPVFQNSQCTGEFKKAVLKILESAVKKIGTSEQIPKEFRPAEKKLYTLLKKRAEEELSLEEMCTELWGARTDGHTKTLYTYIYRIKHILEKHSSGTEILIKAQKGRYKLTFKNL